jgi:hypothetical protein
VLRSRSDAVRELARLCDNLPLALRITAARLAGGSEHAVGALVAELSDTRQRLGALSVESGDSAVESVLASSYHAIQPQAAALLRLLGIHSGEDIEPDAAAALLGASPAEARSEGRSGWPRR